MDLNSIVEYSHRALAGIVSIMILSILVLAWRRHREYLGPAAGLLGLVLAQAALGGATVEDNLEEAYVAAHLCLAMLLLGGLIGRCRSRLAWRCSARSSPAGTWPARRTTDAPTTSSATAPTMPAARSSRPAMVSSCRSARPS
jgi:hypothetical protein